jgi:hypothetical protein
MKYRVAETFRLRRRNAAWRRDPTTARLESLAYGVEGPVWGDGVEGRV